MIQLAFDMNLSTENMMLPAGIALIVAWLMLRLRKRSKHPTTIARPSEQLEERRQAAGLRGDLEQVMVEVEQLAKRFGAQLDTKSVRLEKLIEHADARIARLEKLNALDDPASGNSAGASAETTTAEPESNTIPEAEQDSETARAVYRMADAGNDPIEIAKALSEHVGKIELILALRET